jgi:hypothetical protein
MKPGIPAPGLGCVAIALVLPWGGAPAAPFVKVVVPLGGAPQRVVIGDVDGDSDPDLVVLSASTSASGLQVLLNDGAGGVSPGWSAEPPPLVVASSTDLELGDLDDDGDLDLVVTLPFAETAARLNAGDGTFGAPLPLPVGGHRVQNELGDLDGDAFPDDAYYELDVIAYVGSSQGHGDGTFEPFGSETLGMASDTFARTALGDVTGDGLEDLVVAAQSRLDLVPGAPGAPIQDWGPSQTLAPGDFDDAAIADLDGDRWLDVVATKPGANAVAVLLGAPLGSPTFFPAGRKPLAVCVADMNGDALPDVVVTSGRSGTVEILLGSGGGGLLAPVSVPAAREPLDVAAADLDADGDVDLAVTDTKLGGRLVLLLNQVVP